MPRDRVAKGYPPFYKRIIKRFKTNKLSYFLQFISNNNIKLNTHLKLQQQNGAHFSFQLMIRDKMRV